jgi:uncharacterized protein YraI
MSLIARRNPSRSSVHVFPRILALSAIVLSMCGAVMMTPGRARADSAVTTSALNLRYGGSLDRGVILVMPSGASVEILGGPNSNNFYKVNYNGTNGYAYADYISTDGGGGGGSSSSGASGDATVDSALNLRSRPSTSASVILVMPGGAAVSLTGNQQNGFLELSYQGTGGWGYADYISTGGGAGGQSSGGGGSQDAGSGDVGSATTTSALNLRSGPSTSSSVILVMPGGAGVTLTGTSQNGFSGVTYQGTTGWAYADYLDTSGVSASGGSSGGGIVDIIYAAADAYGQSRDDMLRVATCESGLDPNNYTPPYGASGLFQFLPGTWASTPFASYDIFDPWASANAAAWMWSVGRRGEWVCQ